jgi:hypothetical protein
MLIFKSIIWEWLSPNLAKPQNVGGQLKEPKVEKLIIKV